MRVGSLFAGIGGIDLGFEREGFTIEWQVEINEFCRHILARHFPAAKRFIDVRECGAHNLSAVDVILAGFPCQDISIAGKGAGIDGERSGLWREVARIAGELRPRFVVVENVPALLQRGMGRVLGDLAALGLDAEWECLPACAFGAPHRRERILVIAYPNSSASEDGREVNQEYAFHVPAEWLATQGIRSLEEWQRWIVSRDSVTDSADSERWFYRMDDGLPNEMERIAALGNGVVPIWAQFAARRVRYLAGT